MIPQYEQCKFCGDLHSTGLQCPKLTVMAAGTIEVKPSVVQAAVTIEQWAMENNLTEFSLGKFEYRRRQ